MIPVKTAKTIIKVAAKSLAKSESLDYRFKKYIYTIVCITAYDVIDLVLFTIIQVKIKWSFFFSLIRRQTEKHCEYSNWE